MQGFRYHRQAVRDCGGKEQGRFLRYGTILLAMLFSCVVCVMPAAATEVGVSTFDDLKSNLSNQVVNLITITGDIAIDSGDFLPEITHTVTITSAGSKRIYRAVANASADTGMFTIGLGDRLTLNGSVVLDGNNIVQTIANDNIQPLVRVNKGGTFNLTESAVLKNNTARSGGGVYVYSGIFNMSGLAIVDEYNEVYLNGDCLIQIDGSLTNGGAKNISIGVNSRTFGRTNIDGGGSYADKFGLNPTLTSSKYKLVQIANDLVLSANITLILNKNGGVGGTDAVEVTWKTHDFNTSIVNSTRLGYTFSGWYTDESCTKKWSFADGIPGDMTLYAKWIGGTPTLTPTPAATTGQSTAQQTTTPSLPVTGEPTGDTSISPTDDSVSPSGDATGGVPPTGTGTGDDGSSGNSTFSLPLLLLLLLVLGLNAYYLYRRYT